MNIEINTRSIALRMPDDVNETLIAATGFSLVETARRLSDTHVAGDVAAVLLVFADGPDVPPIGELATEIADAGIRQVAAQLASTLFANTDVLHVIVGGDK